MLTAGTGILLAVADDSLIRPAWCGILSPLRPLDPLGIDCCRPLDRCCCPLDTYYSLYDDSDPQPPPGLYPAPESRPVLEPLPTVRSDRYEPSSLTVEGHINPAAEALLPVDPGAARIRPADEVRSYQVDRLAGSAGHKRSAEPIHPKPVVKIVLRRTDTYHKGAMIDFFC